MVWLRSLAWLTFDSMESAIYGIAVAMAIVILSLAGYIWYLTPGKHDRLE
jgi:hypothetical protein